MSVKFLIQDGQGTKRTAGVTTDGALKVTTIPASAKYIIDQDPKMITRVGLLNDYFLNDNGSSEMSVDGSATNAEFYIHAQNDRVKCISAVKFIIESSQMSIADSEGRRFGTAASSPGLANGIQFFVVQEQEEKNLFADNIYNLSDLLKYCDEFINEPDAVGVGIDLVVVKIKFEKPVYIVSDVSDHLTIRIRDDLSSIDSLKVIALGTQELI